MTTVERAEPVLAIRDLSVSFPTETGTVSAVDGVSLDLAPGEIVGMVGESGCGKSVTAMSIAGLLPGSARITGSVRLDGTELVGARESALRRVRGQEIAYIFQEPMTSLNPVLTVGRQIGEVLQVHERMSRRAARARAVELLTLVGIPSASQRVDAYPHQLSGGMRQRVMIAMAVACGPKVLVADEPTTALDVTVQAGILQVLRDLRDRLGTSVLIITHDLGVIADIADRVVVMYAGRVVERAPVDDLFAHPQHHYTAGLLSASPQPGRHAGTDRLTEIPGLVPVLSSQPDACTFADRCPAADAQCRDSAPALREHGGTDHLAACWHPCSMAHQEANR
ncbi:ABC transporter ATP-binding protein [Micromonospora parathelypteridis]|uniref:Peptide/nickel transport system ATP-binding protein n=1 Tax=Micromonospora parathelypteridis TaxID=1839617 RepID=A0A840VG89_9ACTN|nr:ABC transporter ATP-binding protein [Micromonospora parathelypteridis]MBB5475852.1 peptide/nickel transport system ATP-binding protein [Micromonospora parathelypteridis]GGO31768.1 ABC transporter ATP-binding protein [Micromonospora parathelypteridis]